jgi:hypothetical protein
MKIELELDINVAHERRISECTQTSAGSNLFVNLFAKRLNCCARRAVGAGQTLNNRMEGNAMDLLSAIGEIIRDLLIFVGVMFPLLVALIVIVSKMPEDNPLKRLLTALTYRVGATMAAGAVAIPIEPIPGIDALYDFAVPIALIWYWFTFFRDAGHMMRDVTPRAPRQINHDGR